MVRDPLLTVDFDKNQRTGQSDDIPKLRVGFVEECDLLDFKLSGKFSVYNDQGIAILEGVTAPLRWRLKIENRQSAKYEYNILINKFASKDLAAEQEYKLIEKGIGASIKTIGGKIYYKNKMINNNTEYWLIVDHLSSQEEAHQFAEKRLPGMVVAFFKQKLSEPHALLELYDNEFEKLAESENMIKIVPDSENVVTYVYDLKTQSPPEKAKKNYVVLKGPVEFRCMDQGKVAVISKLTIQDYVCNVVAHHCYEDMPIEVLEAMAVCVRSKAFSSLSIKHNEEPFDFCSGYHCQLFAGNINIPDSVVKAVDNTGGLVLKKKNRIIDANYAHICGGFTEASHPAHDKSSENSCPSVFDGDSNVDFKKYGDLSQNQTLKKWLFEAPEVFCNPAFVKDNQVANYFANYFRWKITYDREELEEYIASSTGKNIGTLFDIIPIRRGNSGRIKELEILASDKNLIFAEEASICKNLSETELPSCCFIVEQQLDHDGFPISFTFFGAGLGHGIGLCQAGAVALALQNATYDEILKHYFRGTVIKKIYEGS